MHRQAHLRTSSNVDLNHTGRIRPTIRLVSRSLIRLPTALARRALARTVVPLFVDTCLRHAPEVEHLRIADFSEGASKRREKIRDALILLARVDAHRAALVRRQLHGIFVSPRSVPHPELASPKYWYASTIGTLYRDFLDSASAAKVAIMLIDLAVQARLPHPLFCFDEAVTAQRYNAVRGRAAKHFAARYVAFRSEGSTAA